MFGFIFGIFLGCTTTQDDTAMVEEIGDTAFDFTSVELGVQAKGDCVQYFNQLVCDIILKDQNDEYFRLYDHVGEVILLDFSTGWCFPCKTAAATVQEIQDQYETEGFLYVTIMIEDDEGQATTLSFASEWADRYGIETAPVLQGSRHIIDSSSIEGYNLTGWPTFYVINRDMQIDSGIRGHNEEWIHQHIQDVL